MVVTQPDRPRGRGQKVAPSPVKEEALRAGLPLYQPEKFNSESTWNLIEEVKPDLAVVVAYAAKIGPRALESVPRGWLNLHPSKLPKYRGAAPMQWALMEGEATTGLTTFFLNREWDAVPICLQKEIQILAEEDYGSLSNRCAVEGAELILRSVELIALGQEPRIQQDDHQATFAPLLQKADTEIDWTLPAGVIENRIRGLTPLPGARTAWNAGVLKIQKARAFDQDSPNASPGQIVAIRSEGIDIQTGQGVLRILNLQPENKKPMEVKEFLNGRSIQVGLRLGRIEEQ